MIISWLVISWNKSKVKLDSNIFIPIGHEIFELNTAFVVPLDIQRCIEVHFPINAHPWSLKTYILISCHRTEEDHYFSSYLHPHCYHFNITVLCMLELHTAFSSFFFTFWMILKNFLKILIFFTNCFAISKKCPNFSIFAFSWCF